MSSEIHIVNARMLELIEILKKGGTIRFSQEFYDAVDFRKENISNVRKGVQGFSNDQIINACRVYGVNGNWILGIEREIFRKNGKALKSLTSKGTAKKK